MDGVVDPKVLARRQKDVDGFVDQYEELLQGRVKKYGKSIRPTWERTAQRLDLQVKKLFALYANADGKLNEKKLAAIKYKADRLDTLKKSLLKALEPAESSIRNSMTNNLVYEYAKSYHFSAYGLEQAAQVAVEVPALTVSHVMGVIANPWLPDGATYSDRLRSNTAYLADKMYQAIGQATVEGWTVAETAARIRSTAGEGFFNSIRLARTEFTRAAAQGASHLYMENADILDGKRWNATLDSRTAPKDARNDGKLYPLEYDTAESPGKPGERIPNHPHCRCRWTPILSALGISTKERIARGEGDTPTNWGERSYTKARDYEAYAKERGLPSLADRLAGDDPRRYLRRGEAPEEGPLVGKRWEAPTVPQPKRPAAFSNPNAPYVEIYERYPKLAALGNKLHVTEYDAPVVQAHIQDLSLFPEHILQQLNDKGLQRVYAGNKTVPFFPGCEDLRGVRPRGWGKNYTWDNVPGCYRSNMRTVVAGAGSHGSASAAIHETSHAIGDILRVYDYPELRKAHKRLYGKLPMYLQQGGPGGQAGMQELLAESLAILLKQGRVEAVRYYDEAYVYFLEKTVLQLE